MFSGATTMTRSLLIGLLYSGAALAGPPTTRPIVLAPTTPAVPIDRPSILDAQQPAFVPKFAITANTPAGRFDERAYARRFTYPAGFAYGFGYGGCGYGYGGPGSFGWGGGSWGSTTRVPY